MNSQEAKLPTDIAQTLVDPAAYADERIYDAYRWMRANNPLGYAEPEGFEPFWAVSRYDDLQHVSRNNDLFRNATKSVLLRDAASDAMVRGMTGGSPNLTRSLVDLDDPEHRKLRLLTNAWFLPKNLASIRDRIEARADAAVEKLFASGGQCDFARDIALYYPLQVIMDILGVPPEDEALMLRLTQESFAPRDPDSVPEGVDLNDPAFMAQAFAAIMKQLADYFEAIEAKRRADPQNDMISLIANGEIKGEPISRLDAIGYYLIIATAGHDTTSTTASGAMIALARDPALLRTVKDDPSLIPALIEEAIRFQTPVKTFMRTASADTEINGRTIRANDWLMLCYASANRDEAVFDDADSFRLDRKPNIQMAFGTGGHVCLGQHLAKLELRVLFEKILARLKSVELAGDPQITQSFFVNGPKSVPIRFEAA